MVGLVLAGVLVFQLVRLVQGWCGGVVEVLVERVKEVVKNMLTITAQTTSPTPTVLTQAGDGAWGQV